MALNSQNLTAQGMGNLAEEQMKKRVLDQAMASPNTVQTGAQMGATPNNGAIAPTAINYQAMYQTPDRFAGTLYDPDKVAAKEEEKTNPNVLTSQPANAYINDLAQEAAQKEAQLKEMATAAEQAIFNTPKDQELQKYAQSKGMGYSFATPGFEDKLKEVKTEGDRANKELSEQQTSDMSTQRAAEFYGGRAGGSYSKSVISKLDEKQAQQRQDLAKKELDLIKQAWDSSLNGAIGTAQQLRAEANRTFEQRLQIEQLAMQEKESMAKLAELEDNRAIRAQDRAMGTIKNIVDSGMSLDEIPQSYLDELDFQSNAPKGFSRNLFEVAQSEKEAAAIQNEEELKTKKIENASKLVNLLKETDTGGSVNIGGNEYIVSGKSPDYYQGVEVNDNGDVTYFQVDPKNPGNPIVTTIGSGIGKQQDGWEKEIDSNGQLWFINPKTRQVQPAFPGDATTAWSQAYPQGEIGPALDPNSPNRGQCGAACNYWYGDVVWGDTIEQKTQVLNQLGPLSPEEVDVGSSFVMKAGKTGHVGVVNQVTRTPDGKVMVRISESNMQPPGGRTLSHDRVMAIDDPRIVGFVNIPTPNLPLAGPDAPSQPGMPTFGNKKSESEKPLSADEIKKYGLDPTKPENVGLTLSEVQARRASQLASQPVSPDKMTFEDFAAKRSTEIRESGLAGPISQEQLKSEYEEHKAFANSLKTSVNAVKRGKFANMAEKQEFVDQANALIEEGDYDGLESLVNQVGRKSMSVDQQNKYDSSRNLIETYQSGMDMLTSFAQDPNFKTGNIKRIIESAKKKGAFDSDPRYAQLEQLLGAAQNEYRNALFGASLTPGEMEAANKVIIDPGSDTPADMWEKMKQGAQIQEFVSDVRLADALGMPRPKLNDYLKK